MRIRDWSSDVCSSDLDEVALAIREAARQNRVPLVEAPPLARALYRGAALDAEVPVALYSAVAQILGYVYQLKSHASGAGTGTAPPSQPDIGDVPHGPIDDGRTEERRGRKEVSVQENFGGV